jgi:cysteine synthase A
LGLLEMNIAADLTELIGNTPLVEINNLNEKGQAKIFAKLESFNPLHSAKDRIALNMIEEAEKEGRLIPHVSTIIEPTSGNTGVGLAYIGAIKGYKVILTMPENMSIERRKLLKALGAEIVLTNTLLGMNEAISKAQELANKIDNAVILDQFNNMANPEAHCKTTGREIWRDTDGRIDVLIATVGTGGTLCGSAKFLKEKNPRIQVIAVEPSESPVLAGGEPSAHGIQGIGAGFVPNTYNSDLVDEIFHVKTEIAIKTAKELACKEGILAGISSGAAMYAASRVAQREANIGKIIVTVFPDTGERYISTELFE